MTLDDQDVVRLVPCALCRAPVGQPCTLSRARRAGGTPPPGDWRISHAARRRAALWKIVDAGAKDVASR